MVVINHQNVDILGIFGSANIMGYELVRREQKIRVSIFPIRRGTKELLRVSQSHNSEVA